MNRRNWLKQVGLGAAGLSVGPLQSFAAPATDDHRFARADAPIRLSSNENPYGPSPLARIAMREQVERSNRYGWDLTSELVAEIAKRNQVPEANIVLGAGSTEILDLTVRLTAVKAGTFVLADPTYPYWTDLAQVLGLQKIAVPLTADKRHDLPAMLKAIKRDTRLVYICNPNNPTGTFCDNAALAAFVQEATQKAIVLVDEAYLDFTGQPSLGALAIQNKNLVVAKTFSKIYGLAGARVGYAIAHAETLDRISQQQSWPNGSVGAVSAAGALASLKDERFVRETYSLNEQARTYTLEQLGHLGIPGIPSCTNFLYFSLANYKKDFFERLKTNNIIGTRIYEESGQWSRITIGTMAEMQQFIRAIE